MATGNVFVLKKFKFVTNLTKRIKILITILLKGPTVITITLMTKNHLLSKKNDCLRIFKLYYTNSCPQVFTIKLNLKI